MYSKHIPHYHKLLVLKNIMYVCKHVSIFQNLWKWSKLLSKLHNIFYEKLYIFCKKCMKTESKFVKIEKMHENGVNEIEKCMKTESKFVKICQT